MRMRAFALVAALAWAATGAAESSDQPKDGWFTTSDHVKIHYLEIGQGVPVILVHGYRSSAQHNYFDNGIAQALARNHRVIGIDCRNHGLSDKPQPGAPGKPEDVVELVDHLGIRKAHFQGYSMGGNIVSQLLVMIPERILSLSLGGSGIPEVDPKWRAQVPEDKPVPERFRMMMRGVGMRPEAAPPGLDLSRLDIGILAIVGEFDLPNQRTSRLKREAKNFQLVVLPGRDHISAISPRFDPAPYTKALVEFINAHDPK